MKVGLKEYQSVSNSVKVKLSFVPVLVPDTLFLEIIPKIGKRIERRNRFKIICIRLG